MFKQSLLIAVLSASLYGCGSGENAAQKAAEAATPAPVVQPVKPPVPSRFYTLQDGLEYGYEQAVSADDKNKGQVASKILMFKYLGERGDVMQFHARQGEINIVFECQRPCEFIKQMMFIDGVMRHKEHMRAIEGSIAWALTQDAMNGYLKPYEKERAGKISSLWIDEKKGLQWSPVKTPG